MTGMPRHLALALAGVTVAGGALAIAYAVHPLAQNARGPLTEVATGRLVSHEATLARFAAATGEYRNTADPAGVAGARKIPIVAPQHTPLVAGVTRTRALSEPALFRDGFRAWRQLMLSAGRGGEDPRCTYWLFLKETAWGKSCWGRNTGNRKARCYANRATILAPRDPHVYDVNPRSTGIFLLIDQVRSFDSYRTFATFEDSLRDEQALFSAPNYAGVLDGYRAGGLAGLKAAITAMHRGGYSPGVLALKLRECEQYWDMAARRMGNFQTSMRRPGESADAYTQRAGAATSWVR